MGAGNSRASTASEPDRDIKVVRELCSSFYTKCKSSDCATPFDIADAEGHVSRWLSKSQVIPPASQISDLSCPNCATSMCAGCGAKPKIGDVNIFTPLGVINHCCDKGRLFGIWFLLARLDHELRQKPKHETPKPIKKEKKKGRSSTGVGYGGEDHDYGYAMNFIDDASFPMYGYHGGYGSAMSSAVVQDNDDQESADSLLAETLQLLTPCLSPASNPAEEERSLLGLSLLLDRLSDLLRNDSIEDITSRIELYSQLFKFLLALGRHPNLIGLLLEERPKKHVSPGLQELSFPRTSAQIQEIYSPTETTASLFACGKNTYKQARYYLKLLTSSKGGEKLDKQSLRSSELCKCIIEVSELLQSKAQERAAAINGDVGETWSKFEEENRLTFTDEVLKVHKYHSKFAIVQASAKGRLNAINKEIATMMTSLPPGIFVKVAESRSDVMKFMIVGSEGSPYAGGLFTFDMFLPLNYPRDPPLITFVLEGNDEDMSSFNPNLHIGGNVCLSLLNTWHGDADQQWQPYKSTILSVLVSIQAMILGAPYPWLNEPGRENWAMDDHVLEHNKFLQVKTTRHAMIAWAANEFKDVKGKEYIWKDIAQAYMKHHGPQLVATVKTWAEHNPSLIEYSTLKPYHRRKKPKAGKAPKGKASIADALVDPLADPTPRLKPLKKLSELLGIEYQDEPAVPEASSASGSNGKRKRTTGDSPGDHMPKKMKQEEWDSLDDLDEIWVYTGPQTQKEVRKACKEFGIGAASTIHGSISKLELHVNGKGKVSEELVAKWGKMIGDEDIDDWGDDEMGTMFMETMQGFTSHGPPDFLPPPGHGPPGFLHPPPPLPPPHIGAVSPSFFSPPEKPKAEKKKAKGKGK